MQNFNASLSGTINIITAFILILLAIATLRDVIIKFNLYPKKGFLSRWFKSNYEIQLLKDALEDMGYTKSETEEIFQISKETEKKFKELKCPEYLISLIVNYIYTLSDEKEYGNNTKHKSKYYIPTMEMVHNDDYLIMMTTIMCSLIASDEKRKKNIDFIIVPKSGNPLLANSVAKNYKANLLVLKGKKEESSIKIAIEEDPNIYFKINFEGGNELLKRAEANPNKKLNGIVVDCNASGGAQVLDAINNFNAMVDKGVINAEYVSAAYVLFRADDSENKFDNKMINTNRYRLVRYFDLNEELKCELSDYALKNKATDYINEENIKTIDGFIDKLKQSGKMYYKSKRKKK